MNLNPVSNLKIKIIVVWIHLFMYMSVCFKRNLHYLGRFSCFFAAFFFMICSLLSTCAKFILDETLLELEFEELLLLEDFLLDTDTPENQNKTTTLE